MRGILLVLGAFIVISACVFGSLNMIGASAEHQPFLDAFVRSELIVAIGGGIGLVVFAASFFFE